MLIIGLILGMMLGICICNLMQITNETNKRLWDDVFIKHYDFQLQKSLEKHGYESQCRQYMEESSELSIALNKWLRNNKDVTCIPHICEEVADVMIMLQQIKLMCKLDEEDVNSMIHYKIKREMKRIGYEEV